MSSDQPNMNDLRMFCHAVDSRMTDNDLLVGLRSLTGLTARIDELEALLELGPGGVTPEDIGMVPIAPLDNGKYTIWRFPDE